MERLVFERLSPGGKRGRLSILIYHRVAPQRDELFPGEMDQDRFDRLCGWLAAWFNVLPLDQAIERLYAGDLPPRALAITFDDGYADNLTVAAPILLRHGLPCTFFIAAGFLDGGCMWNDVLIEAVRRTALPRLDLTGLSSPCDSVDTDGVAARRAAVDRLIDHAKYLPMEERQHFVDTVEVRAQVARRRDLMMTSAQLVQLRAQGFGIGGHTMSHPILARLSVDEARREIVSGREALERLLGEPVRLFAYPNGKAGSDYSARMVELARDAGFDAAVSTNWGVSTMNSDRFQLPRFTPWDAGRWRFALRMASNLRNDQPVLA